MSPCTTSPPALPWQWWLDRSSFTGKSLQALTVSRDARKRSQKRKKLFCPFADKIKWKNLTNIKHYLLYKQMGFFCWALVFFSARSLALLWLLIILICFLDKAQMWREAFSEHRFSLHPRTQTPLSSCVGSSMSLLQITLFMKIFNEST